MDALVGLTGMLIMVVGLVTLIKPIRRLKIGTRRRAGAVLAGGFALMIVGVVLAPSRDTVKRPGPVPAPVAPAAKPALPPDQAAFVKVVLAAKREYQGAANDLAKGGVRAKRRAEIAQALPRLAVSGWLGRVGKLDSNSEGKGVLAVIIAEKVTLTTWNNALSDILHHTLIAPGGELFRACAGLKEGAQVTFSGTFFPDPTDHVHEQSLTLAGSILSPVFTFKFGEVKP
jgi:hypothetical protein